MNADSWLHLRSGDTVVCDASDGAIPLGLTSAAQLRRWVGVGVAVYSRPGVHAKVGAISRWAFVGSANASDSSATTRDEAVLLTAEVETRTKVRVYVQSLLGHPSRAVDATELDRLDQIKVNSLPWPKTAPAFPPVIPVGARLHLWDWEYCDATPDEERHAKLDLGKLAKPDRRSDWVEETLVSDGDKVVLPPWGTSSLTPGLAGGPTLRRGSNSSGPLGPAFALACST